MAQEVVHQITERKFVIKKDGSEAHLEYEEQQNRVLDMHHTFVPPVFRGQGMAQDLAKAALTYAKENNFKVIPSCSFVAKYIEAHPEYKNLLA